MKCACASPPAHRRARPPRRIGEEVETLYTNGPAGGGGATRSVREVVAIASTFIPRALVPCTVRDRGRLMKLWQIAHARSGDKGTISNISLIAFRSADYARLARHVTAARVRERFAGLVTGEVRRYELPSHRRAELRPARDGGRWGDPDARARRPRQVVELGAARHGNSR